MPNDQQMDALCQHHYQSLKERNHVLQYLRQFELTVRE